MQKTISKIILVVGIISMIFSGIMYSKSTKYIPIKKLIVTSKGIKNGVWEAQYGAASNKKIGAMPTESVPLTWSKGPSNTKSYAITLIDNDAVPVIGFPWIHWVAANIPANITSLEANASRKDQKIMIQGVNSYADGYMISLPSIQEFRVPRKDAVFYGGMSPVGFAHTYTLKVYALDTKLDLKDGYTYNELVEAMQGHIVGEGELRAKYDALILQ